MTHAKPQAWRFDDGSIDIRSRTLIVSGKVIGVEPKVFDLIAYLIEHRDRAIGKDELISAVWASTDVSDATLGQAVRKARKALRDSGNDQGKIKTMVRFGFRWVAPVDPEDVASPLSDLAVGAPDNEAAGARSASQRWSSTRSRRVWSLLALLLVAVVGCIGIWFAVMREDRPRSLAVMPAQVMTDDLDDRWISVGIMAVLRERLTAQADVPIVADADVATLLRDASAEEDPAVARGRLRVGVGARWILETTVAAKHPPWIIEYRLWDVDRIVVRGTVEEAELTDATNHIVAQLLPILGDLQGATHNRTRSLDERYARATHLVLSGQLAIAEHELLALAHTDASSVRVQTLLAEVERRLGHANAARTRLMKVIHPQTQPSTQEEASLAELEALKVLAHIELQQRHLVEAERTYTRLLHSAVSPRDVSLRADALSGLAFLATRQLDYATARDFYARARALRQSLGGRMALAQQDANEGVLALEQGRALTALDHLHVAHREFRALGLRQEVAMTLFDLAQASAERGRLADQRAMLLSALSIYQDIGDRHGVLRTKVRQVHAALLNGEFADGLAAVVTLVAQARRLGYATVAAEALYYEGLLLAELHRWADAQGKLEDAHSLYIANGAVDGARDVSWSLAELLALQGKEKEALVLLDNATAVSDSPLTIAGSALHRGNVLAISARVEDAIQHWDSAYRLASQERLEQVRIQAAIALANALIDDGQFSRAEPIIGILSADGDELFDAACVEARYFGAMGDASASARAWMRAAALRGERILLQK